MQMDNEIIFSSSEVNIENETVQYNSLYNQRLDSPHKLMTMKPLPQIKHTDSNTINKI